MATTRTITAPRGLSDTDIAVPHRPPALASLEWVLAHPRLTQTGPLSRLSPPTFLLMAAASFYVAMFGTLSVWRHDRFGTFDHDLGIWDQAVWLLAHGESFITVRGLDVFGFHASPALYVFAPASWLGAGPSFLNLAMIATYAAGALVVYRIARHHLGNEWHALVLAVAFLANYAAQWMMWETFHPEVIAVTPLLLAYLAALEGRWRAYACWLVFALLWKEDVALVAFVVGAVLAVRNRRTVGSWAAARAGTPRSLGPAGTRRAGVATMVAALTWFLVATRVLIPLFSPGGSFTDALFGDLGSSPIEIAGTAVTSPDLLGEHLSRADALGYGTDLTSSFGFAGLLAPLMLLAGLPQLLINTLAIYDFFWTTRVHYAALPLFATAVASVEGVARVRRRGQRRALLGAVAIGAFFTAVSWGISPVSPSFDRGYWPLPHDADRQARLEQVVALPGPDESVSAMYNLVPHLTHRSGAYTFPNPWRPANWGVADQNPADPATLDWLIVDPGAIAADEQGLLLSVLRDPDRSLASGPPPISEEPVDPAAVSAAIDRTRWEIVINEPDLLALRRQRR